MNMINLSNKIVRLSRTVLWPITLTILQELLDLINQSFEPPDLDLPDSVMNMSCTSGGGMLEHWLGEWLILHLQQILSLKYFCSVI